MTKISDLTALTGAGVDTAADLLPIVDMSLAGAARNKKITIDEVRIGLGLGTAASPQFGGINLGHASDTTLARSGAGDVTIEGNAIYRAGGTDVPVADGGTGASTAAGAATNLGLGTGDSPQFAGVNLGHASDTTITRVSAGVVAIEGVNIVTTAGGVTFAADIVVPDEAYDATAWNGSLEAPTKNAIRDKIEALSGATFASTTEQLTGTESGKAATPDSVAALWEQGSDVASAGTISIGEGGYFFITGTTTITDIDFATDKAGRTVWVKFAGALTLTHNASTLILPTGVNIVTAAGDTACFVSEGSDVVRCVAYNRATGAVLRAGTSFPGSPATNDRFYRTDRGIEYFYDGTQWLSEQIHSVQLAISDAVLPFTATTAVHQGRAISPFYNVYGIYLLNLSYTVLFSGTGNWTFTIGDDVGTLATLSGLTGNTSGNSTLNVARTSTQITYFRYTPTENSGTASVWPIFTITFRLIG